MARSIRNPWNPWTTSFSLERIHVDPPIGRVGSEPTPTRVASGVFALAWQRDERGTIERLPIDAAPAPLLRE